MMKVCKAGRTEQEGARLRQRWWPARQAGQAWPCHQAAPALRQPQRGAA